MPETTTKMMTRQETFNKAYLFILKQGKQSKIEDECQYRGPDGLMCAAGCLIDDAHYQKYFEGNALDYDSDPQVWEGIGLALVLSGVDKEDLHMVRDLQIVHDGLESIFTGSLYTPDARCKIENDFVTHWKAGCARVASKYGLTIPAVKGD